MAHRSPCSEIQSTMIAVRSPSWGTNLLMSVLGILGAFAAASTNGQLVSSVHRNIALQIFFATTLVYVVVKIMHDQDILTQNASLLISGHIRFLSGTLSITILLIMLSPYLGWPLLVLWTVFLVKIAFCWDKPFCSFEMFKAHDQTTTATETPNQNANAEIEDQNVSREEYVIIEVHNYNTIAEERGPEEQSHV